MIIAWFMRYGSLELQTFEDVDDLAETLVFLVDADMSTFDQWGCFSDAEDAETGLPVPQKDIDAAEARVKERNAEDAKAYVPPKYSHVIYIKDRKGRKHRFTGVKSADELANQLARLAGLIDRVEVVEVH